MVDDPFVADNDISSVNVTVSCEDATEFTLVEAETPVTEAKTEA